VALAKALALMLFLQTSTVDDEQWTPGSNRALIK